jgi:hypothetical protein
VGLVAVEHIVPALAVQMRMFPGIPNLSLHGPLDQLQQALAPLKPGRGRRAPIVCLPCPSASRG